MGIVRIAGKALTVALAIPGLFWLGHHTGHNGGYSEGYSQRDRELTANTHTEYGLKVLRKDAENKYLMLTQGGQEWEWKICRDRIVSLTPGMTLKQIKYEERGQCKSLAVASGLGFIIARNELGQPIKERVNYEQTR